MFIYVILVLLIGVVFITFGYLIFTEKAPSLIDFFFNQGVMFNDRWMNRLFGSIIIILGIFIMLSPLVFGVENMNV